MAGLVHKLRHEEESGFEVLGAHERHPLAGHVASDEFDFGEHGAELAHGPLHLVGESLEGLPGDVPSGGPLPLGGFFVEHDAVFRPDIGLGHVVRAEALSARAGDGAAQPVGHVAAAADCVGVAAEVNFLEGQSLFAGDCGSGVVVEV